MTPNKMTPKEFLELPLIASLYDPYVSQQKITNESLILHLNTIRSDPLWQSKIWLIFDGANSKNRTEKEQIAYIYTRILKEIWFVQNIIKLQRKYRKWTYASGNPGHIRRQKMIMSCDDPQCHKTKTTQRNIWYLCCVTPKRKTHNTDELEWSD